MAGSCSVSNNAAGEQCVDMVIWIDDNEIVQQAFQLIFVPMINRV